MNRLHPPTPVLEIANTLENSGFEAWFVGGAIRDSLLGHPHLDWDLATSATPTQVRELFGARRTIPVGIEFGTVGVLDRTGAMHEVTTFRRDVDTDGRHAVVEFGASLDDDLARRDFTINAIAYSESRKEIRDPFGGQQDLGRKIVRAVGDPSERMREDRLRALRAIRFASRFGFAIDVPTYDAIVASAPFLGRLSPERVKQELDKTMEQVRAPSSAFRVWQATGAFKTLVPALNDASSEVFVATDFVAIPGRATRPAQRTLRYAALLASLSSREAGALLTQLKSSRAEIQTVVALVERWHALGERISSVLQSGVAATDADVRRWVSEIGRLLVGSFMRLALAMWSAAIATGHSAPTVPTIRSLYRRMLECAFRDAIDLGSLAVDGDDLRRAGIPPRTGPR